METKLRKLFLAGMSKRMRRNAQQCVRNERNQKLDRKDEMVQEWMNKNGL
jgi:hypothetical protein